MPRTKSTTEYPNPPAHPDLQQPLPVGPPDTMVVTKEVGRALTVPLAPPRFYSPTVLKALHNVMRGIGMVDKAGLNTFHKYNYAKAEDIIGPVRDLMIEHDLILIQSETSKRIEGGLLLIEYEFTWAHTNGESLPPVVMSGGCKLIDQKGVMDDKAVPKCHTQAEKYFLIKQLRIKVGDLPDSDEGPPHERPPAAGPNVIGRGAVEPRSSDRKPALADQTARQPAPINRGAAELGIKEIAALEAEARAAADRGSVTLATFWKSLVTKQQQNVVSGLMAELIERRNKADEAEAEPRAQIDPETGEIINP